MFIFPNENKTGLPPVPFHQNSPLHTLKVTEVSVKLNRMECKKMISPDDKKIVDFKSFVVWVNRCSTKYLNQVLLNHNNFKH